MQTAAAALLVAGLVGVISAMPYKEVGRYQLNTNNLNWTDAHQACKDSKGFLAIPQSVAEADELNALLQASGLSEAHAGFHDWIREGNYISVFDQALKDGGYYKWADDSTEGVDSNCGSLSATGLKSIPCDTLLPSICQLPLWSGYEYIQGHGYYRLSTKPLAWVDAWQQCRSEGAYLLIMRNTFEADALQTKYADVFKDLYTVQYGAHHMFADHDFVTVLFDEQLTDSGYYTWHSGYPGVPGYGNWTNTVNPVVNLVIATDWKDKGILLNNREAELPYICKHDLNVRGNSFVFPVIQPA